jgi:DNA-binding CsgD family transcriptional regulator
VTDADFWRMAEAVLTEKQLTVLRYKAAGFSKRRIALVLDVAVGTIEGHLAAAERRLRHERARVRQDSGSEG